MHACGTFFIDIWQLLIKSLSYPEKNASNSGRGLRLVYNINGRHRMICKIRKLPTILT